MSRRGRYHRPVRETLLIRLDGRSPGWLAAARALVRDAGHQPCGPADGPPDVVLAEERLVGLPPGALGIVAGEIGDGLRGRLEALLRRPAALEVPLADGRVDLAGERVLRGDPEPLTAVEAALLRRLVRAEGRTVAREDLLRDVWGVGPSVQTRALDTAVRRLRAKIEPDRRRPMHLLTAHGIGYRFVPAPAPDPPPHALGPAPDGPLFGREAACAAVERAGRWVTLVGPGGVGKSRLARACAERLLTRFRPGGAWLCDLSMCDDAGAAATAVARALGLPGSGSGLADALAARGPTLLVLDDIDRVAPALGPLVAGWLAAAPGLSIIATGRRATGHPAEATCAPGPLEAGDAAALFRHRAGLDDPAIAPLVALLDHLPLAIALAADRARLLPPAALLDRLRDPADHVALLSRPGDDRREGAVDRVLAGSWALLDPVQRRVAARCSVFRGPFTAEDAERVCGEPATLDALHGLVASSIVRRIEPGRLALFETIRCWLALRLEGDDAERTGARHRRWCVALAEAFAVAPMAERARRFAATAAARHDLRAAFADPGLGASERAALAVAISAVFARTGPFVVARDAVRLDADLDPIWAARLACARARHGVRQGSPAEGFAALAPSLRDAEALPVAVRAGVMLDAARCAPSAERSAALAEAADGLFAAAGDPVGQAAARMVRSRIAYREGRPDLAMGYALRATDTYRRAGIDDLLAPALANLALTFTRQSSWPEARRCADEARRVAGRIGDPATEAIAVAVEGYISLHQQDFDAAAAHLGDAVRRQRALALRGVARQNQLLGGLATVLSGRLAAGRALVDSAAVDAGGLRPLAEACSAALAAMAGEQALARHRAAESRRGDGPTVPPVAEATRLFLAVVDAADDWDRAARLLAEADVRATTELTVRCARWLLALRLAPRAR